MSHATEATKVLYYNIPTMGEGSLAEAGRLLRDALDNDVLIVPCSNRHGTVLELLRGPCRDCTVVEIDRTDPDVKGFSGLQAARRSGSLSVRVLAFVGDGFIDVGPDENIMQPLRF